MGRWNLTSQPRVWQVRCFSSYKQGLRPRSHCSFVVMICFCCTDATRSHYSGSVQKRKEKHPFLSVHIDPSHSKYGAQDVRFCAFTLLRFCEAIVEYWSVFKNLRFCAFTLIQSVFKNLCFCGYPLSIVFSRTSVFVAFLCRSM